MANKLIKCCACKKGLGKVQKFIALTTSILLCNECVSTCADMMLNFGLLDLDIDKNIGQRSLTEINIELSRRSKCMDQLKYRKSELTSQIA